MKSLYFLITFFLFFQFTYSQKGVAFKENKQLYLHGSSILIGNNILGDHPTKPLMNRKVENDAIIMKYIDVDDDKATFSSSEASIINPAKKLKVSYAALYWCGFYPSEKSALRKSGNKKAHVGNGVRDAGVNSILFKTPNGTYEALNGKIIFDSYNTGVFITNSPYVCYADVTKKLNSLTSLKGTYTVANVKATEGEILGGGSAGWLLYIIYEDDSESPKYFTTYDGLVEVDKEPVEIIFRDFKSKKEGKFKTSIALGTMEGDHKIKTDEISIFNIHIADFKPLSNKIREENNFFNSSITIGDDFFNDRNPNNANTLGFDLLKMEIPNPYNELLDNATTQVNLRFQTKADHFYPFFVAFETEINEAFLEGITKIEEDIIIDNVPLVEVHATPKEAPSKNIVSIEKKESKSIEKNTPIVTTTQEKVVSKNPIVLSQEERIKNETNIQSMSVPGLSPGYYLVTNVFSSRGNATKWSQFLEEKNYSPQAFINPANNWNYVYVTNDKALIPVYEKWKEYKNLEYFKKIWIVEINP